MAVDKSEWRDAFLRLLALASRLEGEGQYSIAKLARAAADSMSRRAAYKLPMPFDRGDLLSEIERVAAVLSGFGVDRSLLAAFRQSAVVMSEGRLPLIDDAPDSHVCRTCGHVALGEGLASCPTCGAWPDTFQRFPPVYWLDALDPPAALEKLRQTPLEVSALLEGLPEEALGQQPAEGGWSIHQALTHLRDAQDVLSFRLNQFLTDVHPVLESKAIFEWAAREEEGPQTTLEILKGYITSRRETLAHLEKMGLGDWWRAGLHKEFGTVTLKQQVSYFAAHERTHLPQIKRLRDLGQG